MRSGCFSQISHQLLFVCVCVCVGGGVYEKVSVLLALSLLVCVCVCAETCVHLLCVYSDILPYLLVFFFTTSGSFYFLKMI